MTQSTKDTAWETEIGLPSDFDAVISNPRFGEREEYVAKIQESSANVEAKMLLIDLVDDSGEIVATQGYTIGKDWIVSGDGLNISHPKRKNVVTATLYGQLQNRVVKELAVNMDEFGVPTSAISWNGLKFHWMIEEHVTVGGPPARGLMPTEFLGKQTGGVTPRPAVTKVADKGTVDGVLEKQLVDKMAEFTDVKQFQLAAIKMPGVAANDPLMASVLDEGPGGFWATHQG